MTDTLLTTDTTTHQIVFIDSRVPDLQSIMAATQPGVKVVVLNATENGVAQMAKALQGEHGLSSISVVSHGDDGVLLLGNGPLHAGNLDQHQADLKAIGDALGPDGDLLLYGCDVGAGEVGAQFLQALAHLTGADVAASNDATGGAVKGGDWDLEITTGAVGHDSAIDVNMLSNYEGNLATLTASTIGELRTALTAAATNNQSDTITLLANIGATGAGDVIASVTDGHKTFVDINITDSQTLEIVGGGNTLDANYYGRVLEVRGGTVTISDLTIREGLVSGRGGDTGNPAPAAGDAFGGGIRNAGTLTLTGVNVTANGAAGGGGGGGNLLPADGGSGGGGGGGGLAGIGGGAGGHAESTKNVGAAGGSGVGGDGGGGAAYLKGKGGTTIGGTGANGGGGYSNGSTGATATSGGLSIGGGGGGAGYDSGGGRGGNAAGGIYNSGTLTISSSTINGNIGAGGGGGGGALSGKGTGAGGNGGNGVGGITSTGTLKMDTASSTSLSAGANKGVGGSGGESTASPNGTAGTGADANQGTITPYTPPSITSATYDASTAVLSVTAAGMTTGDTIDVTKLSLTGQGGSYTLTTANVTASSATAFSVTLNAADKLAVNGVLNNNGTASVGATTFNLAGAANWDVTASAPADLTGNAVTVSNVSAPTITSATYNGSTHVFTVTGTGLVKTIGATNDVTISALTITGEGGATRTLSTTGNVEVTSATSFTFTLAGADIAAVDVLLNNNGTSSAGSSTTYNLAAADDWNSVVTGGNIQDLTGNGITVSNAPASVSSATYDAATGILSVTGANFTNGGTIDVSKLSLTGQGGSYTLTTANVTAGSTTAFAVTLNAADKLAINGILNNNGTTAVDTTTFNLAAAANWEVTTSASADLTSNGVTVSNVAAPTITSATYDGTTHVFTVTGTGLVKTVGATNDITISKLTIIGEGGATRTLSTTGNVEVTSATSFTFTLAGADIAAVDSLLNKNGTSSAGATTYNIAAADDWNSVITGGNIADLTSNAITVSNAAPSIASATYDAATGILSVAALNIVGGDTIDVSKLSLTGQGGSYTLTTANVTAASATAFAVTLNAADKLAINGILNTNGTSAVDTTVFNLAAAANWDQTTTSSADLTSNGVTVSNVAAPTITSATFDGTTNVLTVTGTGLVKTIGATNDITVNKLTVTGEGGATYTLSTSGNVEVTSATSFTVTLTGADIAGVNNLLNNNGTSALSTTTYNIAAADDWNSVITGASIADLTGNGITVSNAAPTVVSAAYNASTATLVVTGANMVAGDTIDVSKLSLTGQGGTYTLTTANVNAASATSFTVVLNPADQLAVNGILNKDGTTAVDTSVFNLAAAASWDTSRASTADLTGNAVTVSAVTAPTITSATFDGTTNVLTVTGTGLVKTIGATNDITVSKLTVTGEGGATYTLATSGNVEVTSATSFSVTLSGADIAGVGNLLNKNGTSAASSTIYNIAAADDWNSAITGGNIADLTSNAITVSNAPASLTNATYDATTGILSVTGNNLTNGGNVVVGNLTLTGQGGSTYTLTTGNTTATSTTAFSVTLNAADQLAVNGVLNKNGTSAVDATAFNLAAAAGWQTGAAADPTGNGVTVSALAAPTITSATYDTITNVLTVTGTGLVKTLGATNDITVNKLTISGEGGASYTLGFTGNVEVTSATSFSVTLSGPDVPGVAALLNKNGATSTGGTAYNLAAADDWNSVVTGGNIADAVSALTVSSIPAPTITSATYDAGTGALVVTGTGFKARAGTTNDIVANKFTFTGEGGLTHTLTTTADVEIASAALFTLTLSAADQTAIRAISNKNGPNATGGTAYNLAAAEDWAAGADAAVVIADATNAVTVSNVAVPTVTSATYNVGTGVLVVTGTGLLGLTGAANDVVANKLGFTGKAGGTYTLTDTPNADITSSTSVSLTLSATDKAAVNLLLDKAGTSSTDATTYNIAFAEDWNAGADAAVVIADLTGNAVTVDGFPGGGGGTPPATGTVDGVPVTTEPGPGGSTVITIPVVVPTRPEVPGTSTPLADIPLVTSPSGTPIVSVSVPTGVGLQAEGLTTSTAGAAALAELGFRIERVTGNNPELTNAGQVFYATLSPNEPLSVQILKPTIGAGYDGTQPLVINGSTNPADGKQAVIIDARALPSGTVIQVDNIEFVAVVGNVRIIGGAGQNMASGDSGAQYIVLGPDDDVIHGGGGNDTVGSEAGDDQVYGDAGDDIVFGGAGNDLLSGGTGSDRLNGGTGFDVAIQEGKKTDYTVTLDGAGIKLTHTASGVSDWLVDVEQVRFETGPSLTVAHSAAEEAGAYLFQKWIGRDLNQGEGAVIQSLTGMSAEQVATLFAQVFPEQSAGKTPAQLLEGMAAAGAIRVDAVREVTVTGDAGNNTITPTLGLARYVDGGAGIDTVVIPATLGQTYVQHNASGSYTLQRLTDGAMLDVTNVERVTLNDTKLALDLNGNAGEAARLLGALAGPGMLGSKGVVGEVIRMLDAGASSQTVANLGLQLLGVNTPTQIAQTLWTNVVGRAGTASELKILTDIMAGGTSAADLVVMAAHLDANAVRIDLVGLTAKGIEFA